jgi:hypothetical protein
MDLTPEQIEALTEEEAAIEVARLDQERTRRIREGKAAAAKDQLVYYFQRGVDLHVGKVNGSVINWFITRANLDVGIRKLPGSDTTLIEFTAPKSKYANSYNHQKTLAEAHHSAEGRELTPREMYVLTEIVYPKPEKLPKRESEWARGPSAVWGKVEEKVKVKEVPSPSKYDMAPDGTLLKGVLKEDTIHWYVNRLNPDLGISHTTTLWTYRNDPMYKTSRYFHKILRKYHYDHPRPQSTQDKETLKTRITIARAEYGKSLDQRKTMRKDRLASEKKEGQPFPLELSTWKGGRTTRRTRHR